MRFKIFLIIILNQSGTSIPHFLLDCGLSYSPAISIHLFICLKQGTNNLLVYKIIRYHANVSYQEWTLSRVILECRRLMAHVNFEILKKAPNAISNLPFRCDWKRVKCFNPSHQKHEFRVTVYTINRFILFCCCLDASFSYLFIPLEVFDADLFRDTHSNSNETLYRLIHSSCKTPWKCIVVYWCF